MHRQLASILLFISTLASADSKLDSAKNMCAEFAKSKPTAQQKAFTEGCVESMTAPKLVTVFPDTDPISVPTVMSDGRAWYLQHFLKAKDAAFRGERLVKYTSFRPTMSDSEARAKGLRIVPTAPFSQTLYFCGEVSADGGKTFKWFAVEAKSDSVGRKGPVVFEPPPLRLMRWEDEKGVCISGVKLS
jgi:hypothetical protein